jgi:aminomethyltransferase
MKDTPLIQEHIKLGAKLSPFGGWNMPISYSGIIEEHNNTRKKASLFDISHMGEFLFKGDIHNSGIEQAVTQNINNIYVGRGKYGFILNENGGIIDDLIIFRLEQDEYMLVVNALPTENDFNVIKSRLNTGTLTDISSTTAKLDLQGPLSRDVLKDTINFTEDIRYFSVKHHDYMGEKILISRTGYTGELGYEIYVSNNIAVDLWNTLLSDERVSPAGLGARDILRLEIGYSLYGSDLNADTTPLEARLEFFIDYDKDFTGRNALLKQKTDNLRKIKIAFKTDSRRAPRPHYKILSDGIEVGDVTSGCFSPMLSCGIGMGYVKPGYDNIGTNIEIRDNRSNVISAQIVELPFYKNGSLKS